ncbi:hypothetical protein [Nocardia suismassiliense]|uniref:hypothetical protein n=1 Tax=Nocardia suismassiliense TaxID=2077092 RepID=UPI000D1F989C|nr:hypothetical protein [Nocardia suismassiliense]
MADREKAQPSPAVTGWTVGLVCVAIVASGVIVGGLLHEREPELTTKPVPTATPTSSRPPVDSSYVTPPVVFPVEIPGCAVVAPPTEGGLMSWVGSSPLDYDNPAYPWFSGPKAVAMSRALRDALPDDVDVGFASVEGSLLFEPILGGPEDAELPAGVDGWTTASGTLRRGAGEGWLMVSVRQSAASVPPCVAGNLDERRQLADGTTVDVQDTWYEINKVRTLSRTAHAYLPDGTEVTTAVTDDRPDDSGNSGTVPLTVDELAALAAAPGLRVTTPVPPGTPNVPESCSGVMEPGGKIDESITRRLDAVLARIPLDGLTLDRPLGQLRPADLGTNGVCQAVRISTPGRESRLNVSIATQQRLPDDAPSNRYGVRVTTRRLPDGTVIETGESRFTVQSQKPGAQPVPETERTVTVTRPSGTRIQVSSTAADPIEPLPLAQLEAIATTPDLEVR